MIYEKYIYKNVNERFFMNDMFYEWDFYNIITQCFMIDANSTLFVDGFNNMKIL